MVSRHTIQCQPCFASCKAVASITSNGMTVGVASTHSPRPSSHQSSTIPPHQTGAAPAPPACASAPPRQTGWAPCPPPVGRKVASTRAVKLQVHRRARRCQGNAHQSLAWASLMLHMPSSPCLPRHMPAALHRSTPLAAHLPLIGVEHAHALHLVEHGVVRGINRVAAVHVARHQKGAHALPQDLRLVRAGVAAAVAEGRGAAEAVEVVSGCGSGESQPTTEQATVTTS